MSDYFCWAVLINPIGWWQQRAIAILNIQSSSRAFYQWLLQLCKFYWELCSDYLHGDFHNGMEVTELFGLPPWGRRVVVVGDIEGEANLGRKWQPFAEDRLSRSNFDAKHFDAQDSPASQVFLWSFETITFVSDFVQFQKICIFKMTSPK